MLSPATVDATWRPVILIRFTIELSAKVQVYTCPYTRIRRDNVHSESKTRTEISSPLQRCDKNMISEDITTDQILAEMDEKIELLEAMADKNVILAELLHIIREAKALIKSQILQIQRLEDLVDFENVPELSTILPQTENES
jgi:hypothetical protein